MRSVFSKKLAYALAGALLVSGVASADVPEGGTDAPGGIKDTSAHTRPYMISVWGVLPWYYGIGVGAGARVTIPLVHDGFIPPINDSFELELGADILFGTYGGFANANYMQFIIPAEFRWTFHITPAFSAYPMVGLGYRIVTSNYAGFNFFGSGFYHDVGAGLLYKLGDAIALRAAVSYNGLRVGVGFNL